MIHLKYAAIALISSLTISLSATADSEPPKADMDGDGKVTRAEFDAVWEARFAAADANHDGYISADERGGNRTNNQAGQYTDHFDRLDANSDGLLTREEFSQGLNANRGQRRQQFGQRRVQQWGQNRRVGGSWDRIDTDGDTLISVEEFRAGADKMFNHLDANGDGILEQGEGRHRKRRQRR